LGVPLVARGTTVVPETLAGAGIQLDPADGPCVLAEAWHRVVAEAPLRERLGAASARRFDELAWRSPVGEVTDLVSSLL